jgi:hypothetical protein
MQAGTFVVDFTRCYEGGGAWQWLVFDTTTRLEVLRDLNEAHVRHRLKKATQAARS